MSAWDSVKAWLRDGQPVARPYPTALESVDVSADLAASPTGGADYSTNPLKGIYVGDVTTGGPLVYVKLREDSAFRVWDCVKGMYIEGIIVGVGASTTAQKLVGLR